MMLAFDLFAMVDESSLFSAACAAKLRKAGYTVVDEPIYLKRAKSK